jgi:hypothetical protein
MTRQSIFGLGLSAKSLDVSSQRRLNCYLEIRPQGDKSRVIAYGTPGLSLFVDLGDTPIRGFHSIGNFLYVVHRGNFWEINNAGVKTLRGSLTTTTGRCYFADNGTQIMLVDGTNGYVYNTSTLAFAQITDVDFVQCNTVTWMNRYFIVDKVNSGRFYISAIDDPTSWNALDFANAEGSPDNLVRVFADHGEFLPFGDLTTEFWGDSGSQDFPFTRLGSAVVEWGLAARDSLCKFDSSVIFLGKNRMGKYQVVVLNGYIPTPVGGSDFITAIEQYTAVSDATAYSYMQNGHPFYQINFPTAGKSWLYDGLTKIWSEVGYDTSRHPGNLAVLYLNSVVVGDYQTGKVYRLDQNSYTDNGTMIPRELVSKPTLFGDNYTPITRFWVDMETGIGLTSGQGSNPQVMLSVSKDGGNSYGTERWHSAGKIGEYSSRVYWNRLGSVKPGEAWTFKIRMTDPNKFAVLADGWIDAD